ncbi:MAG: hemolysin III family protein [Myxococcales bacterium]|nr:hemolysin III family protein [Myxococcales bacterium]
MSGAVDLAQEIIDLEEREEFVHALTHGFGLIASMIGSAILVSAAWTRGDVWHGIGCTVFSASLVLVYAASTLYHGSHQPARKRIFQRMDHLAIYFLIAGTYTPFTLAKMQWPDGLYLLTAEWTLAAIGIAYEFVQKSEGRFGALVIYNLMAWMMVFAGGPLLGSVETGGAILLVLGGVSYTVGIAFYLWDSLPFNHAIWHGFVLAGSAFHFGAVLGFVVPA